MPELPEVQSFKAYFDRSALQQKIVETVVHDAKIIRNQDAFNFSELTRGRSFVGSYRRGKYLFPEMDNGHHLLLHFGMTGDLNYYQDSEDQSKHERFVFHFENGYKLGFDCPRKFARILYLEDRDAYIQKIRLGEDILEMDESTFLAIADGKKSSLKGFLLNQKLLSGVGNLYADEVCYQTQIHPASVVKAIPKAQLQLIFQKLQDILQYAIQKGAYYKDYPPDWLWEWRAKGYKAPDGSEIASAKIGGRTTYYFDTWQTLYQ